MDTVIALHEVDADKLEDVIAAMRELGAPTVRVIDAAGYLWAVEGTHRLEAASRLGLTPRIVRLTEADCPVVLDLDGDEREWGWEELCAYVVNTMGGAYGTIYEIESEG